MRAILPGRPPAKHQAICTALWDGFRIIAYISGRAVILLTGHHKLVQTIYVDDIETLEAVAFEETSGSLAVSGGQNILIYKPFGREQDVLKWSQVHVLSHEEPQYVLSWGSSEELLVGGSSFTLWYMPESEEPAAIWRQPLANPVKIAAFSPDAALIASTGYCDRLVKIWRRMSYESDNPRFDVSYLVHPTAVTNIHWRKPWHGEQSLDNLLYTICADNKIRIWTHTEAHAQSTMQLWNEIDMNVSIQPRRLSIGSVADRRYGFMIDSRDFSMATERAVHDGPSDGSDHALEHLIEIATRSPEICVVLDGNGYMSAWGLENAGCRTKKPPSIFNIAHVDGLNIFFGQKSNSDEDYAQFCIFAGTAQESPLSFLVHYYDGRINWFDAQVTRLFDNAPHPKRVTFRASWSGHDAPVKKINRSVSGSTAMSRTNDSHAVMWQQKSSETGPVLVRQSSLDSPEHIHRTCVLDDGRLVITLHRESVSLWDTRSLRARVIASSAFQPPAKPLTILQLPSPRNKIYVATIFANMEGMAWEITPLVLEDGPEQVNGHSPPLQSFCSFRIHLTDPVLFFLPVDPAGSQIEALGFLDIFAPDVAISLTSQGTIQMLTAKVDTSKKKVDWLVTSSVETSIENSSLVSGSSIRKAALVDEAQTTLTIWDTSNAQLEFEERFSESEIIQDLDWTSTPDDQSILAVGFPHRVLLLSQLRYNYLNKGPAWCPVREVRVRDLTPHPIGDSCWLAHGHLVVGAGNQLFVYDREVEVMNTTIGSELRLSSMRISSMDLFEIVRRLNGSLPVFHPQFLGQCILSGKTNLVHKILLTLHRKLKFWTEGDEIANFLDLPMTDFFTELDVSSKAASKEMKSSFADFSFEEDEHFITEETALILSENLTKVTLSQISSQEQFYLADIVECVAAVEKHRRSMDDNAARYLLFFRQYMLRQTPGPDQRVGISWREIVWAFHSSSQDILIDLVSRSYSGKMLWKHARESGLFVWISDIAALRSQIEIIARNEYTKGEDKSPIDCSLFYLALRKKSVLQGLWRMTYNREQAATLRLLGNNFNEPRWKTTAKKNAYALLSKRRFEYAAAFFLLADSLPDAVNVCVNQLKDIQLAVAIIRAYDGDDSPVLHDLIHDKILPEAAETGNRWMATWAFWMINRRDRAVRALISPVHTLLEGTPSSAGSVSPTRNVSLMAKSFLSDDPALVVLYRQLREKTLQTLKGASMINPREEWEFIMHNARLYTRMGCDLLALDLTRNWEFLLPPPPRAKRLSMDTSAINHPRNLLRRRSSLVVDDMQQIAAVMKLSQSPETKGWGDPFRGQKATDGVKKAPPTVFEEPESSSLLDSFGF